LITPNDWVNYDVWTGCQTGVGVLIFCQNIIILFLRPEMAESSSNGALSSAQIDVEDFFVRYLVAVKKAIFQDFLLLIIVGNVLLSIGYLMYSQVKNFITICCF